MEGEGFEDLLRQILEKFYGGRCSSSCHELDENDLVNIINETNNRDNNADEEESEPAAFTAKIICRSLELGTKLSNYF